MAAVAQLVRALDCDSRCRRFNSGRPPQSPAHGVGRCANLLPTSELALLTCAQMGAADAAAIAGGTPGSVLMEAAGKAVADAVIARYRPASRAGPVRAGQQRRRRLRRGAPPAVKRAGRCRSALLKAPWRLAGRCRLGGETVERAGRGTLAGLLDGRPLVIDALFGAGLTRPIEGVAAELIERIDQRPAVSGRGRRAERPAWRQRRGHGRRAARGATVTFFRAKPGHYSLEGLRRCGALHVVDIGIPARGARRDRPAALAQRAGAVVGRRCGATIPATTNIRAAISRSWAASRRPARRGWRRWPRAGQGRALPPSPRPKPRPAIYRAAEPGNLVNHHALPSIG